MQSSNMFNLQTAAGVVSFLQIQPVAVEEGGGEGEGDGHS